MAGEGTRNPADTLREALGTAEYALLVVGKDNTAEALDAIAEARALLDSHVLVPRETVERAITVLESTTGWLVTRERIAGVLRACLGGETTSG